MRNIRQWIASTIRELVLDRLAIVSAQGLAIPAFAERSVRRAERACSSPKRARIGFGLLATLFVVLAGPVSAQEEPFKDVVIGVTPIAGNIYMLTGAGGNIAVSAGSDGLLIVDDQYAPLAQRIATALAGVSADVGLNENTPVTYVINTHYHGDHTGNNPFFAEMGATIVAHDNVRVRLLGDEATPETALPAITHRDGMTLYFNDDALAIAARRGHTDGDSTVLFEKANVLHTGDLLFNQLFPYIDVDGGGSVSDYLTHQAALLELIDDQTVVIPGHGPLADKASLEAMHTMIKTTLAAVQAAAEEGATLDEILAEGVAPQFKQYAWSFISEERWLKTLYGAATAMQ